MKNKSNSKRVYCLYRVSSKLQIDRNNDKNDIPMQKQACHEFATRQGWEIVAEHAELGVSGFKVSAKDRDAIQDIQRAAAEKKFDILLCFMFDRIGRIDSETPFVVEWFINNGIEVWSVNEGQQRLDSHTDKLLNYIRYWQASGESVKTAIRTKTRIRQIAQEGLYHGGSVAFGYRLVKKGRTNKRGYEIRDIEVNPYEAEHVKTIFHKYVYEGMGFLRISDYLTKNGITYANGKTIKAEAVGSIIRKTLYTGVMVCGDVRSEHIPALQIIDEELFQQAQRIRESRKAKHHPPVVAENEDREILVIPTTTRGEALLSGNVRCGTCGGHLYVSTGGRKVTQDDGTIVDYRYSRYLCYNKSRKKAECNGQSGYTVKKLDRVVSEFLMGLFHNIKGFKEHELVDKSYQAEIKSCETKLKGASAELHKHTESLKTLQNEVVKSINGESKFEPAVLNELIAQTKDKIELATQKVDRHQSELDNRQQYLVNIQSDYNNLISWSEIFESSTPEAKKMIAAYLINNVKVTRGYNLDITLNVAFEQFFKVG